MVTGEAVMDEFPAVWQRVRISFRHHSDENSVSVCTSDGNRIKSLIKTKEQLCDNSQSLVSALFDDLSQFAECRVVQTQDIEFECAFCNLKF